MNMKTNELTGLALDWAVAQCEGYTGLHKIAGRRPHEPQLGIWPPRKEYGVMDLWELSYSTDWAQGGPIIEREEIGIKRNSPCSDGRQWEASPSITAKGAGGKWGYGPTPLVAAMRCYVASKLGDDIDIPEELV
jgi:hypothetical protein